MMSKSIIAAFLFLCSATSVSAMCSICGMGKNMKTSWTQLPANTISFVAEESTCMIIELKYVVPLNETDPNCAIAQNSTAPSLCGCAESNTTEPLPNALSMNTTKSQVNLTLISVSAIMDNATIEAYEDILTMYYKQFLAGIAINVSAKVAKQHLVEPKTRLLQEDVTAVFPLNTTINITGTVDSALQWAYSGNFSALCANITKNNTPALIAALKQSDLSGNTSYYSSLTQVNASKIVPSSKPKAISTKKPELPKGVTAGIMIGIFAVLCAAVYAASLGQGERLLQREIAREQREAAAKARHEKMQAAKKVEYDDDLDEA
jgi:hypothetical protein